MATSSKDKSLLIKKILENNQWYTILELANECNCSQSTVASILSKLLNLDYVKKEKYLNRRIAFYAKSTALDLIEENVTEDVHNSLIKRSTPVFNRLKSKPKFKVTFTKSLAEVKNDSSAIEEFSNMPRNALNAIEAIGKMAEDNAMLIDFVKQIHEQSGKILSKLS